ncbi:MAG: cadherin-like domain-containing protein [Pseudomonadota bacterium]
MILNQGDGQDRIQFDDIEGFDTLAFGEGLGVDDISLRRINSYDLAIKIGNNGDQVKLTNWFHPSLTDYRLDRFTFADGTVWDATMLAAKSSAAIANTTQVISGTLSLGETCEDGSLIITEAALLAGVTDSNGDTLNVIGLTASSGTVTDNGDGTWSYAPAPDFTSDLLLDGAGNYVLSELIGAGAKLNRNIYFSSDRNEQNFHNHL